jgi:hypothetical protein
METFYFKLSDLPESLYHDIAKDLGIYSVGLISIESAKKTEKTIPIGSGTLIKIGKNYGILSAEHVTKELKDSKLGLVISEFEHRLIIDNKIFNIYSMLNGSSSSRPDLSFIHLPETTIGTVKAKKSFYNLDIAREAAIQSPMENDFGIWFICGFPDELTKYGEQSIRDYDDAIGFTELCGAFVGISKEYDIDEYDYYDISVDCGLEDKVPISYAGVSGGGLWQVQINQDAKKVFSWGKPVLSGVAFFQSDIKDNKRIITCHGKKSLYNSLYRNLARDGLITANSADSACPKLSLV